MNLIGLDIGTTSICGVLYSKGKKKSLKVTTRNNVFISSLSGEYQQSPEEIFAKVKVNYNLLRYYKSRYDFFNYQIPTPWCLPEKVFAFLPF
jgi:hypothetical protein